MGLEENNLEEIKSVEFRCFVKALLSAEKEYSRVESTSSLIQREFPISISHSVSAKALQCSLVKTSPTSNLVSSSKIGRDSWESAHSLDCLIFASNETPPVNNNNKCQLTLR